MSDKTQRRSRLGRGLNSLLNVEPADAPAAPPPAKRPEGADDHEATLESGSRLADVPVGEIDPNPHQPRREFKDAELDDLAASIKANGIIQPLVLRRADKRYQLIAGERRLRAAKRAGLATVPAVVRDADAMTQAQLALVENIQRADLNPIERAEAYQALLDQLGLTQAELAGRLGEDRSSVTNHLRLLKLCEPTRERVRGGHLTLGHAKVLAGVESEQEQDRLAKLVVDQSLSVRNLEKLVATPAAPPRAAERAAANYGDLEDRLRRALGLRVQVQGRAGNKGKVVLHYATLDEFDDLMRRMGVSLDE